MTIWGLVDDRTGHTGQVLGVIAKLGVPYVLKRFEYNFLTILPNRLLGASLLAVDKNTSAPLNPPWPKIVIAAGRRTLPILRCIKKKSPSTVAVYLMWPGAYDSIDLIAAPAHDKAPKRANVIHTMAPLHAVTPEALAVAREAWEPQFAHLPRPWVAVSIGGNTKQGSYTPGDWRDLIKQAQQVAGSGSLLITTSRRTPREAIDMFQPLLSTPHLLHRWDTDKDNPYLGLLGAADAVVVTGDSLSMCAEACVSGKPVFIFARDAVAPAKHRALHQQLYQRGMAQPLGPASALGWQPATPLDDAALVAEEIRKRFPHAL
jgi:mitochondrial fission protein ELM1